MLVRLPLLSFVSLLGCDSSDLCTQLCNFDGLEVCTKGSRTKNGVCYRYRYLGPPEDGVYCYHMESTQEQCPASGVPVKPEDVDHLITLAKARRNSSTQPGTSTEVTTMPVSAYTLSTYTDAVENTYTSGYGGSTQLTTSSSTYSEHVGTTYTSGYGGSTQFITSSSTYSDHVGTTFTGGYTYTSSPTTSRGIVEPFSNGQILIPAKTIHSSTILLLHGMRGRSEHMIQQGSETWIPLIPSAKFVSLDAGGSKWFEMTLYPPDELMARLNAGQEISDPASLDEAMRALVSRIDAEAALLAGGHSKVFLIGYSQGGMLSLWTALKGDRALGGVVALNGAVPILNIAPVSENGKNVPIAHFHGIQDRVVPVGFARIGKANAQAAGCQNYELVERDGSHDPSTGVQQSVAEWLTARVQSTGNA